MAAAAKSTERLITPELAAKWNFLLPHNVKLIRTKGIGEITDIVAKQIIGPYCQQFLYQPPALMRRSIVSLQELQRFSDDPNLSAEEKLSLSEQLRDELLSYYENPEGKGRFFKRLALKIQKLFDVQLSPMN